MIIVSGQYDYAIGYEPLQHLIMSYGVITSNIQANMLKIILSSTP